jgi:hypothetical protein
MGTERLFDAVGDRILEGTSAGQQNHLQQIGQAGFVEPPLQQRSESADCRKHGMITGFQAQLDLEN